MLANKVRIKGFLLEAVVLVFLVLIVLSIPAILKIALKTPIPLATVESSSMIPSLNIGDVVIIVGVNPRDIKVGDIIVYDKVSLIPSKKPAILPLKTPIIHRVIDIVEVEGKVFFITKGDANVAKDSWYVPEEGVLGKTVTINGYPLRIPYVGYFSIFLHNFIGK